MNPELLEKLTEFIQKYFPYENQGEIEKYLALHEQYNTLLYSEDKGKIVGLCRFNVSEDGETGNILDLIIHPDYRGQGMAKSFIQRAMRFYPKGKYLTFARGRKPNKKEHKIPIETILRRGFF